MALTLTATSLTPQSDLFDASNIRTVSVDGDTWFIASDVAGALGYVQPGNAVAAYCTNGVKQPVRTAGGVRNMVVIPESDVFRLVLRSKLPSAKRLEDWMIGSVLPALRRTGCYVVGQERIQTGEMTPEKFMAKAVQAAERTIAEDEAKRLTRRTTKSSLSMMPNRVDQDEIE